MSLLLNPCSIWSLQHYSTAGTNAPDADELDVTFTATTAADGTLLVGSSRDVSWDQAGPDAATVAAMLAKAQGFLPALARVAPAAVRVGLRPQVPSPPAALVSSMYGRASPLLRRSQQAKAPGRTRGRLGIASAQGCHCI